VRPAGHALRQYGRRGPSHPIRRCGALPEEVPLQAVRGPCHAAIRGFHLDAIVRVPAGPREHFERVCRYALRPPIAQDRIRLTPEGDVLLELRHSVVGRHDASALPSAGAAGATGVTDTEAQNQPGAVLRRAGGACRLASTAAPSGRLICVGLMQPSV